ncbi:hypothetical protein EIN_024060 [Entamoeba invadens IP1]|uniref:hypothetical protein n=1 Tax=Entamoeba invadens IP1 TaxID=370355 RepID=UPI0002C3F303|nr:hypothetical protein EIN_024060 [Entamoeba invadens IP1]ELP90697.1 hypothetical protein EIN_024060 [Entamoeba invadens IP1]|eukprot:XP_004257468.1 hypothetical protein EIN_024060 [Entamoeba invadens IP1]
MGEKLKSFNAHFEAFKEKIFDTLFLVISKCKWFIVVFWILLAIATAYFALTLFSYTTVQFTPPKGSLSETANNKYHELYPSHSASETTVVVIVRENGLTVLTNKTQEISEAVTETAYANNATKVMGVYTEETHQLNFTDFFVVNDTTAILIISPVSGVEDIIKSVRKTISNLDTDGYRISVTGPTAASMDINLAIIADMKSMDIFIFPIAILIFLYVIRNIVLVIIPIINLIVIVSVSFGSLFPIAYWSEFYSIAPAIAVALEVAMSVDYSLFLLSRYSEEIRKDQSHFDAVKTMFRHSGRIIATSGSVLICCFLSCCFYGVTVIVTLGLGCVICLIFTVVVNLTITPSLLLMFPKFFRIKGMIPCSKFCVRYSDKVGSKFWHFQAKWMSHKKNSIVVLIISLAILAPVIICMKDFMWTLASSQCFPKGTEAIQGLTDLTKVMPTGAISPYKLLVLSDPTQQASYDFMEKFGERVPSSIGKKNIFCYNYMNGNVLTQREVHLLQNIDFYYKAYNYSTTSSSFLCMLVPQETSDARPIVDDTLNMMTGLHNELGIESYLVGSEVDMVILVEYILGFFPIQLVCLMVIVLLLIALAFQSLLMGIRVIFTTALTIGWVFGLSTVIFTSSILYRAGVFTGSNGLFWSVPVMCTDVLVGLCLDYDIFLFTRVLEYRKSGYSTKSAVILGVEHTGYLITYAGIIMAAAFSALMLSSMMVLQQFGVVLALAILLDTFVIRTMVVPSLLHLFGEWNWWPKRYDIKIELDGGVDNSSVEKVDDVIDDQQNLLN